MTAAATTTAATLGWHEQGQERSALWRSESMATPPRRVQCVDDTLNADAAYRLACEGTALLWRGDFHNARQLLLALQRRLARTPRKGDKGGDKGGGKGGKAQPAKPFPEAFHLHRLAQAQRARVLSMLLIELAGDYSVALRRAPDWRAACTEAWGPAPGQALVMPLRQLLGANGAHEWRKKGVPIPALGGAHIHPHYGVFSPVRGEYVELLAQAPLPPGCTQAFEIGVGTGVLSAVLARRGVARIVATDLDARALACAQDNLRRLGLAAQVQLLHTDLFPPGQAQLVVCNPPWLPGRASSAIERAVYDEDSAMLRGYLAGLKAHLAPGGEGWLILSDLAEHLGLRPRAQLLAWIEAAGLRVLARHDTRAQHPKAQDAADPLHAARSAEVTSLWRLGVL